MSLVLDTTDDSRRARRALGTVTWVAVALGALWLISGLLRRRLWSLSETDLDLERAMRWAGLLHGLDVVAVLAAAVIAAVVLARLQLRPRWLPASAAAAFVVLILHDVLIQVANAGQRLDVREDLGWIQVVAQGLAWGLLAATLCVAGPRRPLDRALAVLATAIPIGFQLLYAAFDLGTISLAWFADRPMTWWVLQGILISAWMGGLALLARRAAAAVPEPTAEDEWRAAGRGLHLFASAVVARVVIVFCFVLLLVLAHVSRSIGLVKLTWVALPLASVATAAVAVAGMASFAHLPYLQGVRRAARAVFVVLVAALLADAVALHAAVAVQAGEGSAFGSQRGFDPDLLRQIGLAAQLASLAAAVMLLLALRATASHIARPELASRATALIGPVLVIAGGGIALRHYAGAGALERDLGLLLLLLGAITSIVVILAFAKVTHRVAAAMAESPVPSPARARYR